MAYTDEDRAFDAVEGFSNANDLDRLFDPALPLELLASPSRRPVLRALRYVVEKLWDRVGLAERFRVAEWSGTPLFEDAMISYIYPPLSANDELGPAVYLPFTLETATRLRMLTGCVPPRIDQALVKLSELGVP